MDARTLRSTQSIEAHSDGIIDFDVDANLVCTCGYAQRYEMPYSAYAAAGHLLRRAGVKVADPIIKVYDIRTMKPLLPIQVCFTSL